MAKPTSSNEFNLVGKNVPPPLIVQSGERAGSVAPACEGKGAPLVEYAARDLKRYLEAATGQKLEIGPESSDTKTINVGLTRYVKSLRLGFEHLDYDGFIIASRLRGSIPQVIIAGRTPYGTYYGVNYFLREYAGVNWLFPGRLGEVIPEGKTIKIPVMLDDRQEPAFLRRSISHARNSGVHNLRSLLTTEESEPDETNPHPQFSTHYVVRSWAGHCIHEIIPPKLYSSRPDYFPLIGGKRLKPPKPNVFWQPCYSNPEVVQRFIDAARKFFDESPYNLCFSIAENDSGGYCECEGCRAMDYEGAPKWGTDLCRNYSDRSWNLYVRVAEAIAESHPGRFLGVYSYLWSNEPPSDPAILERLPGNIIVRKAFPHESDLERFERWSKLGVPLCQHEYIYDIGFHEFRHYPKQLAHELRERYTRGMKSGGFENYSRASKSAPKLWILSRLLWNVREDVDKLMDEYCRLAYGAAAEPMRQFWDKWEDIYMRHDPPYRRVFYAFGMEEEHQAAGLGEDDLDYLAERLSEALHLAGGDSDRLRVKMVSDEYERSSTYLRTLLKIREARFEAPGEDDVNALICMMEELAAVEQLRAREWPFERVPKLGNLMGYLEEWNEKNWSHIPCDAETALDETAMRITVLLGETGGDESILEWWRNISRSKPRLAPYAESQIYLIQHPERGNLLRNPGLIGRDGEAADWNIKFHPGQKKPSLEPLETGGSNVLLYSGHFGVSSAAAAEQVVTVEPDKRYMASVMVKNSMKTGCRRGWSDAAKANIEIVWLKNGEPLPGQYLKRRRAFDSTKGWGAIRLTLTAPVDSDGLLFRIRSLHYLEDEQVRFAGPRLEQICH